MSLRICDINVFDESKFSKYIELLKKLASNSDIHYKHAAALIKNEKIYSAGINKFVKKLDVKSYNKKTGENSIETHFKTIHAEISVFDKLSKKSSKGLDIIVIRINKNFTLKNSRPCNHCIDKLKKIGIRKVFYSNENGQIICEYIEHMKKIHISAGSRFLNRIELSLTC